MPLQCCQRPSSWRKQGQRGAQGRVKVRFFIWMYIPCALGSQFLYVLCLIILISFTMFQSWPSVTAQLQTSRFNIGHSALELKAAPKAAVAESHTCIMPQVRRIHICRNHVPSEKCQNMVCIMLHQLYDTIIYHIIPHFQTDPYHSAETTEGSPGCPSCLQNPSAVPQIRSGSWSQAADVKTSSCIQLPLFKRGYHGLPWVTMGCHSTQHDPTSLDKKKIAMTRHPTPPTTRLVTPPRLLPSSRSL